MSDKGRIAAQAKMELEQTRRAFAGLEAIMLEDIASSASDDTAKRERLYHMVSALRRVQQALVIAASQAAVEDYRKLLAQGGFTDFS